MDTFFCDEPAGDDGVPGHANCTIMQLFLGLDSGYYAGYPMRSKLQVTEAYKDHVHKIGAPIGIMSNNAKAQLHGRTKDLMYLYKIKDGQSNQSTNT